MLINGGMTYNGVIFDASVNGLVIARNGKRNQWSSDDSEQELDLSVSAAENGSHGSL